MDGRTAGKFLGLTETHGKTILLFETLPISAFRCLPLRFPVKRSRALPSPWGVYPIGGTAVPPDWSFQGEGFPKGRGKSKSPFP